MVLSASPADPPKGIAPGISLDELGVSGRKQETPKLRVRKLLAEEIAHHLELDGIPVRSQGQVPSSTLRIGGSWRTADRSPELEIGGLGGLVCVLDGAIEERISRKSDLGGP